MTRFRSMVVGAALVALAACSHDQPGIEVRTVQVPTPVACLARDQIPAEPPQVGSQLNGNAAHDMSLFNKEHKRFCNVNGLFIRDEGCRQVPC